MGNVALAVNHPGINAPDGWEWVPLTRVARLESGHTPSRKKPEYWGGEIPWIGIKDAKRAHGGTVEKTLETTNALGIENSSARVLPAGTICLSRTASVGYVVKMGGEMATSQDFANWVCSDRLDPDFLRYLFIAEGPALQRFSSGSVHQTIYYPELKAFHICLPPLEEQKRIVAELDQAFAALDRARANAEANLVDREELFERASDALLHKLAERSAKAVLGDVADFRNGLNFSQHSRGEKVKVAGVGDFQKNFWLPVSELSSVNIDGKLSEDDMLRAGDIISVRSNGNKELIGRVMLVPDTDETLSFSGFVIRVRLRTSQITPEFLCHYMRSSISTSHLHAGGGGANISNLNQRILSSLPLIIPSLDDQSAFVSSMNALRDQTEQLRRAVLLRIADIADLRQSLLQKAFSGQLTA
jgi:type I restriction enzyme S subunit